MILHMTFKDLFYIFSIAGCNTERWASDGWMLHERTNPNFSVLDLLLSEDCYCVRVIIDNPLQLRAFFTHRHTIPMPVIGQPFHSLSGN